MKRVTNNSRLMESGFPCHQVGAETQRERGSSSALPPVNFLHVWWARRPLVPSRAAIHASLVTSETNPNVFIRDLGLAKKIVLICGIEWTLVGQSLAHVQCDEQGEFFSLDDQGMKLLRLEMDRRKKSRNTINRLLRYDNNLTQNNVVERWQEASVPFSHPLPEIGEKLRVENCAADPAHVNERIAFSKLDWVKNVLGETYRWDPEDLYAYDRAYRKSPEYKSTNITVLDATAGGGSIPLEALRLGHTVIANELNPVATTILYATLDFPTRFGPGLLDDITNWGEKLVSNVEEEMIKVTPCSPLPKTEIKKLKNVVGNNDEMMRFYGETEVDQNGIIYCRVVCCPSCRGKSPLLNTSWLSKVIGNQWGVRIVPQRDKDVLFEVYEVKNNQGPNGENPNEATVVRGVGKCVHCRQSISGDEIKAQARGESRHGRWQDRIYAVQAERLQPKLNSNGKPKRYANGKRMGEIITKKIKFFRASTKQDEVAVMEAKRILNENWARWENINIIPTEAIPSGSETSVPIRYGMTRWCDMFAPRQLLGHITLMEHFLNIQPEIRAALGNIRGNAVITYLQFVIDKFIDFNSRQTRWGPTRCTVVGSFARHDFSLKWTYGEMPYAGSYSGLRWALSQVTDAYKGISDITRQVYNAHKGIAPLTILNKSACNMQQIGDGNIDLICFDPPYYDNVQYGELSDFYYVWQKRGLRNVYPQLFSRRHVNKDREAVANPARSGSAKESKIEYEKIMKDIFIECHRVLSDHGLMTLMFTHKKQDAWETLTRSLIESGWMITACMPVKSESNNSLHQRNKASASSTIFITCRKRINRDEKIATWRGIGGNGVENGIRTAVREALVEFSEFKLSPVDEMIASFGRALQVLSERWPVYDGDEVVSPVQAMISASAAVAAYHISKITNERLSIDDLDTETGVALTILSIFGPTYFAFDELRNLTNALNVKVENKKSNYEVGDRKIGMATHSPNTMYAPPILKSRSKVRLVSADERAMVRLEKPQTGWDLLQGLIVAYRKGQDVNVRAYFEEHCLSHSDLLWDLLTVYRNEIANEPLQKEIDWICFALKDFGEV